MLFKYNYIRSVIQYLAINLYSIIIIDFAQIHHYINKNMESFEQSFVSSQQSLKTNHKPIWQTNTILKVKGHHVSSVYLGN